MPYWVIVGGRGTGLKAAVIGPYKDLAAAKAASPGFAGETHQFIGNQSGYKTKTLAQSEAEKYNSESSTKRVEQVGGHVAPDLPNPLTGIEEIGAVLKAFYTTLTDASFWRSFGWIVIGLGLIVAGIRMWMGKSVLPSTPSVIPIPV